MPKQNTLDDLSFFWANVRKTPGCWNWTGYSKRKGWHGTVKVSGVDWQAHRLSWHIRNGAVPRSMFVLHRCDNPLCVRPEHLFLGTQADNCRDMLRKGRQVAPTRLAGNHPQLCISTQSVPTVQDMYRSGLTQRDIGHLFGVSDVAISVLLRKHK